MVKATVTGRSSVRRNSSRIRGSYCWVCYPLRQNPFTEPDFAARESLVIFDNEAFRKRPVRRWKVIPRLARAACLAGRDLSIGILPLEYAVRKLRR